MAIYLLREVYLYCGDQKELRLLTLQLWDVGYRQSSEPSEGQVMGYRMRSTSSGSLWLRYTILYSTVLWTRSRDTCIQTLECREGMLAPTVGSPVLHILYSIVLQMYCMTLLFSSKTNCALCWWIFLILSDVANDGLFGGALCPKSRPKLHGLYL